MSGKIYNIGQVLTAQNDMKYEKVFGENGTVKKGTIVYVGADGFVHYKNGDIQALAKDAEIKGYSVNGLAEFIWLYIRNNTPVDESLLEEHYETPECIKEAIVDALEELGMYNHMGNRS